MKFNMITILASIMISIIFQNFAMAKLLEYTDSDQTNLYDSECYQNTPEHIRTAPGDGYQYAVPATKAECQIHGTFARTIIKKRDLDMTDSVAIFRGDWVTPSRAMLQKQKLSSKYMKMRNISISIETRSF